MYTVKQVADLAEVSVRTLHYYDEIGLLKPSQVGSNGYRYYDDAGLLRLQQILFYREIGLELAQIKDILDRPDFDVLSALQSHRAVLHARIERLQALIGTIDTTVMYLVGELDMSKKQLFKMLSDDKQKDYERLARLEYGPTLVNESVKRWGSYSKAQKQAVLDEGNAIYADLVKAIKKGTTANDADVQAILKRWHEHLRYFYEPTFEILRGLGELYNTNPDFLANFKKLHADLAPFMREAITVYVDDLETAEIERLLAADSEQSARE